MRRRDHDRTKDVASHVFSSYQHRDLSNGFRQSLVGALCPGGHGPLCRNNGHLPGTDLLEKMRVEINMLFADRSASRAGYGAIRMIIHVRRGKELLLVFGLVSSASFVQ